MVNIAIDKNTGVIPVNPRPGDDLARGETSITGQPINDAADWRKSEPPGEWQKLLGVVANEPDGFETDACVTFSYEDDLESYGDLVVANGLTDIISADDAAWLKASGYFDASGHLNFSDRALAMLSGTSESKGNSLPNVAAAANIVGLVPEALWPFPIAEIQADPAHAWDIYYQAPPQAVIDLGQEFLKRFKMPYHWLAYPGDEATPDQLKSFLKVAPIQIATAVCWPWNTAAPINGCGPGSQHATLLTYIDQTDEHFILDHYAPFDKILGPDYDITYAMQHTLVSRNVPAAPAPVFTYTFTKQLTFGTASNDPTELHALQQALQTLKRANGTTYMRVGVFGPFGPQTRAALDLFQRDHLIADPNPGVDFGPQTRAAMNKALAANH